MAAARHTVITPRSTRLLRVPNLRAFQHTIVELALTGTPADVRRRVVLVPTRGAARQLRRTIELRAARELEGARPPAVVLPELITREELYRALHAALVDGWMAEGDPSAPFPPALLSGFAREVLMHAAARDAMTRAEPPFQLRAGLVAAMVVLYDSLKRQRRTVDAFERLMTGELEPGADSDRGAERMLRQTRFLAATFRGYETSVARTGKLDEHALRDALLARGSCGIDHVVVTIADRAADPAGLWPVDFDLLTRLPGLTGIDVVSTEARLGAGFDERIREQLPEIEEVRVGRDTSGPVLLIPPRGNGSSTRTYFSSRDREEELIAAAAALKQADDGCATAVSSRQALVFHQPLPYLYLATQVFGSARIPYQADDALPLAAEPYAAALDLVFTFVLSQFNRGSTIALFRSPHFRFPSEGSRLTAADVDALDRSLHDGRYFGGLPHLERLGRASADAGLRAMIDAASRLTPLLTDALPAAHLDVVLGFLTRHDAPFTGPAELLERHLRAKSAVSWALTELRDASAAYETHTVPFVDVVATIRRWIEGQTFTPRRGTVGVQLLDARSAPYAELDEVHILGLVENDWPERQVRDVFYPRALLAKLGWPAEAARIAAARAIFHDLLHLAKRRVALSTFTLENEAPVSPSWLLDEVGSDLPREHRGARPAGRVLQQDALAFDPFAPDAVSGDASLWLQHRRSRTPGDAVRFHGSAGPQPSRSYAVSAVERYLGCPFQYFATRVLELAETRDDEPTLTPLERGRFAHEVFHEFFNVWRDVGRGAITPSDVQEALGVFKTVTERMLDRIPEAERALERVRLLGSAAAPGIGERVFRFEAERRTPILERLLEETVDGEYEFVDGDSVRRIRIRGIADRLDLLADGTVRLLDYKIGRAPERGRAVQIPVYALAAEHRLAGRHGRAWQVSEAGYLAFREREIFASVVGRGATLERARAEGLARFVSAVDAIERGEFPPRPHDEFMCERCPYPSVCRKDYVSDEQV